MSLSAPNVGFLLGYGSFCEMKLRYGSSAGSLSGGTESKVVRVPMTSANYDRSRQVPTQGVFNVPLDDAVAGGHFRSGVGVYSYSGTMSFELTDEIRDLIFDKSYGFFKRRSFLDLRLFDGEGLIEIPGCVWNTFSVEGEVGNPIRSSLGFMSCNGYKFDIEVKKDKKDPDGTSESTITSQEYETFPQLQPYWNYGGEGVQSFTLSFNRGTNPCYLNEPKWTGPTYIRVGFMDVGFEITCWEKWFEHNSIVLGDRTLKFNAISFLSQKSYQFAGMSGEGTKTYTNTANSVRGDGDLFTIE